MVETYCINDETYIYIQTKHNSKQITHRFDKEGALLNTLGEGGTGLAVDTHIERDCIYTAGGATVYRYYRTGDVTDTWHYGNIVVPGVANITAVASLSEGETEFKLAVLDPTQRRICLQDMTRDVTFPIEFTDFNPTYIARAPGPDDTVVVIGYQDDARSQVRFYAHDGRLTEVIEDDVTKHGGVCVDNRGHVIVCDHGNARVVRFSRLHNNWKMECLLATDMLGGKRPLHVDVSTEGHLVVSVEGQDGGHSWLLFTGYQ